MGAKYDSLRLTGCETREMRIATMALLSADHRELFLPLVEGIHESPPWSAFLRNLVARMHARRASMMVTFANASPDQQPAVLQVAAPRAAREDPIDFERLAALRLHPYGAMRPGRIYALDEMLDYGDATQLAAQREALFAMRIRYGRWMRVTAGGVADAWLVLVREQEDFSGSAIAVLGAVAAHLAVALRTFAALTEQRLQTALATSALAGLGVGQIAFDGTGRVMAADPAAEAMGTFIAEPGGGAGRRLHLRADVDRKLVQACAGLASGRITAPVVVPIDGDADLFLLLKRAELDLAQPCANPAVVGIFRADRRELARTAIPFLAARYGLSTNEAALAHALSLGEALVPAGRRLNLTDETARNYSKRIYAKTGARGQADLVRMILTGLAPFV
jgi:DNA-binding CsgD family transcriptional regulator